MCGGPDRSRSRARRILLALALVGLTLGDAGAWLHGALVRHRLCEVHRVLEHAADDALLVACAEHPAGGGSADEAAPHGSAQSSLSDLASGAEAAHEACGVRFFGRFERAAVPPPLAGLAPAPPVRLPRVPARVADPAGPPRIVLAPKHSPPA